MSSYAALTAVTAASVPNAAAGKLHIFVDSADGAAKSKDSAGTVTTLSSASALAALASHIADPDAHLNYVTLTEANALVAAHAGLTNNPHATTKAQVGLGNADNTSDLNKPISTATQTALNLKENAITATTSADYFRGDKTFQPLNKAAVGLSNVDNTSDANKPVSTATQTALNLKENTITAGTTAQYYRGDKTFQTLDKAAVGLGNVDNTSDVNKPVSTAQATAISTAQSTAVSTANIYTDNKVAALVASSPAALDTLAELAAALGGDASFATTTATALGNRLRVDTAAQGLSAGQKTNAKTNIDLQNVENTSDVNKPVSTATQTALNLKENTITATTSADYYRGDKTFQPLNKAAVGLGNVDNTSDANKPVSTATQTALNLKYNASNPNGYETPAQLDSRDTANRDRSLHTGSQLAATISDFVSSVLGTVLTGFSTAVGTAVTASDTVLSAIGKLQAQFNVWNEYVTASVLTNNSNVTFVNITGLTVNVVAGKKYRIEAMLLFRSTATTAGLVLTSTLGGGATGTLSLIASIPTGIDGIDHVHQGSITTSGDIVQAPNTPTANTDFMASIEGIFVCTVSGTLTPQFRSDQNGQTVTVQIGSNLIVREF